MGSEEIKFLETKLFGAIKSKWVIKNAERIILNWVTGLQNGKRRPGFYKLIHRVANTVTFPMQVVLHYNRN